MFYDATGNLQWIGFAVIFLWASLRYKVSVKHKIILCIAFVISKYWGGDMIPVLSKLTGGIIPTPNMGIAFAPAMLALAAIVYFLRTPVLFSLDVAVPAFILGRGLAITGCIFIGCCYSFPVSWGIYSGVTQEYMFPSVLMDIIGSCCIVGCLMLLTRKQEFLGDGTVAATGMILFGILRLVIDLLRDNRTLLFLLSAEGLFGIAYVAGGYLLIRYIYHKR